VLVVVVTLLLSAGWLGLWAALVVAAFAVAGSLLIGLLARSPRDMTFLLVGFTTMLSTFLFLPAMFPSLPPIAFLSPMSVVAAGIRGEAVRAAAVVYATAPLAVAAAGLAVVATALYREESLFSPRTITGKFQDAIDRITKHPVGAFSYGFVVVPYNLALEMFVIGLAIVLRFEVAVAVFLVGTALVEEAAKSLGVRNARPAWQTGLLVGGGFWLAEKAVLAVGLLGLRLLPEGATTLATFGVAPAWWLVLLPLALHIGTSTLQASLAWRARGVGLVAAVAIHAIYNAVLVRGAL